MLALLHSRDTDVPHFSLKTWRLGCFFMLLVAILMLCTLGIEPARAEGVVEAVASSASSDSATPWQWITLTFATVFVAEMGDKTQLATMLMSAKEKSPWAIFFGSASALVAASAVSVLLGDWLAKLIPPEFMQLGAGGSFVAIGLYVLWQELLGHAEPQDVDVGKLANDSERSADPPNTRA